MEKERLTDRLKLKETELDELRVELNQNSSLLNIAYQYEDDLLERLKAARLKTENLRNGHTEIRVKINEKLGEMKGIMDVFTGNFYKG